MAETDPVTYFKSEIKRLNYYNSQFLVETDFNDEQLYHKQMRRFHNRALHTWGIVEGLQVERVPDASKVTVSPGIAIDRLGQEIVLPEKSSPIALDTFDKGAQVYITIKYTDVKDPADQDTSNQQTDSDRYSRWRERPELNATASEPAADAPEMVLAVIKLDNSKAVAEVSPTRRRYAGSRIGSSGDGKEFGIYADMAGAWHFYDGSKSADRLTVDEQGNVGIGIQPSAARLSLLTTPGPYDGTLVDFVVESQYRLSLRSKSPARDTVAYHFDLVNTLGRFDSFLVFDRGNVGIGMTTLPTQKLQVSGTIYSDSGGFMFPDGTTQVTGAATAKIPSENVAAGTFGANTGGGAYTFPAQLYWGNSAARTETKNDASTIASKSGFFETSAPVNYYPGANSWQHLIEARHSNNANNYALQIAGSFYDQNLYMRKTNGNGLTAWSQFVLANSSGNVGIGTANPLGPLSIGDSSVVGSDGFIVLGKKTAAGGTRHYRIGFDADFNFTIGDYGANNSAGTWTSPLAIQWSAPSKSLYIDSEGKVGLGTASAKARLDVAETTINKLKSVLGRLTEGNGTGDGTFLGVRAFNTQPVDCKSFALEHWFGGNINGAVNFYRGGGWQGGRIGFAAGNGDEKLTLDQYGNMKLKAGGTFSIGDWVLYGDGGNFYIQYSGNIIARFSTARDRFQVYKNRNGVAPYFYYNEDGNSGNYNP